MSDQNPADPKPGKTFASNQNVSLAQECWEFLRANKMWWLAPIIVVALALVGVVILGSTGAAPFIYTLF